METSMISVSCFTNLDSHRMVRWPTHMACRPEVGDRVDCGPGRLDLRVVAITHCFDERANRPYLRVELHLPEGMSIADYDWMYSR